MDRRLKERLTGATILVLIAVLFIPELLSGPAKHGAAPTAPPPAEVPTNSAAAVRTYTVDLNHPSTEASAAVIEGEASAAAGAVPLAASSVGSASAHGPAAPTLETPPPRPQIQTLPAASPPKPVEPDAAPMERPPAEHAPAAVHETAPPHEPPAARQTAAAHERTPVKDTFAPISPKGGWSIQLGSFGNRVNADKLVRAMRSRGIRVYVSSQGGKHRVRAGPFPDRATAERVGARLKAQGQSFTIVSP